MKKRLPPECIDCVINKKYFDCPETADTEKIIEYKRGVLNIITTADESGAAPLIGRNITLLKEKIFGIKPDFENVKNDFNDAMLKIENDIVKNVKNSDDEFVSALKYAAAGNYVDVSTVKDLSEQTLLKLLNESKDYTLSENEIINLKNDLKSAKNITYVCDNAGEIVLDKILIRTISKLNPTAKITAVVRGKPVANDVTMIDAVKVGLDKECKVVDNGSDIPGNYLKEISRAAKKALFHADVIVSKGQGNFETLWGCGLNVYYLFLCKCDMFLKRFNVKMFSPVLVNEKRI